MKIQYRKGDVLKTAIDLATNNEKVIVAHGCNNIGAWGSGFVMAISALWNRPKEVYLNAVLDPGSISFCRVEKGLELWIANCVTQNGCGTDRVNDRVIHPVKYDWIEWSMLTLSDLDDDYIIMMPKIGAGLGGGDWNVIEAIINSVFEKTKHQVFVYEL